ncbi:efflux RND transporter permease subunit [Sulfurimonas xiamenensis]|uniref:Multidrug efflux RND transporter permease subunit n=1 Tax=Sulfurimonas xiamenensis TaxID=2590021 RepID=A0AAJ4A2Q0_9BACT|nr:multidrug efflux RND transporter permease subunit [Sulfurimonas xiamenensis]QFR42794.1 multidrug efflux RND transporter permease subunit [Sulfurimonas xiamenensis]
MFSAFFIKRPIFASVIAIIIVLAGVISMRSLPISEYPRVIPPQIVVSASYQGASAETISKTVAAPLEEQINGAKDMLYMSSLAADNGSLSINIFFKVGTNPDDAKIDVNNRVQAALSKLPDQVQRQGVRVNEKSPDMLQVIILNSPKQTRDVTFLSNYALMNVVDSLKRVKGIGDVVIFGAKDYSMRIWIDPLKLKKYSLTVNDLVVAVREQNEQYAAGKLSAEPVSGSEMFTYTIETPSRFSEPSEFSEIVIRANEDGSALKLKDVATIELGSQSYDMKNKLNNAPAVPVAVFLQSGANAIETAKEVRETIAAISESFVEDVEYVIPYDITDFVEISIQEVIKTFIEAIILVILIIYLFLQNWRATLIPILAVPVSIVGAFAGMYMLGFSINLLTLFGLVLAIGIVVDDAIIVIENVERHIKEGLSPLDASLKAMKEVSGALVAIVLVLSAVFIPVAFLGGLSGEMYRQFAVTIVISLAISGFVALTLTPSLCALMLKSTHKEPKYFFKWFNNTFDFMTRGYTSAVKLTIRYTLLSLLLFGGLIYITYDMFANLKTGLVPSEDKGTVFVFSYNPPGSSLSRTDALTKEIYNIASQDKESIKNIVQFAGIDFVTFAQRTNAAATILKLQPWDERTRPEQHANQIAAQVSRNLGATSDGFSFGVVPPPIMGMGVAGGFEMYVQNKTGTDIKELQKYVNEIIQKANARPELAGVRTTLNTGVPKYKISVDTAKAKAKGVNVDEIYQTLNATLGSFYVNDFNLMGRTYMVNMQADESFRKNPEDLNNIFVRSKDGEMLPLSSFVTLKQTTSADLVERFNLFLAAKVAGQNALGYSSGDALKAIEEVADEVLPEGYAISWIGTAYQEKQISSAGNLAFIFGIIFLYLILAAQYERWLMPISVILAVPFGVFGAVVANSMRGLENDIYFQIGILVLAGLSAKNAILIVEFAMQKREQGMELAEAVLEAAKIRLRPIIMTSLAFTLGVIPLAISSGAGAASRHSIGTGVVGGMLAATFLAIVFIPLFYILVSKIGKKKSN